MDTDNKKATVNLNLKVNGQDLLMPVTPAKSNFLKDYQIILVGLMVTGAIGFGVWRANRIINVPPAKVQIVTMPAEKPPWENRLVKESSPTK